MASSSNLPSPASSSSSHQPLAFAMSTHPPRAASAASGVSATSGMESRGSQLNNGSPPDVDPSSGPSPLLDGVYPHHQTPQSTSAPGGGAYASVPPQAYLPPITSSPPPHTPQYVPPPQHAMAPDPIHSAQMGMPSGAVPGMMGGPWQAGVAWRGPQPIHQPFRQPLPNGHPAGPGMQHQLPPNPVEAYNQRMGGAPGTGPAPQASLLQQAIMGNGGRPSSAHGEGRDRRRRDRDEDRADKERDGEEEVISTIFVVGFPDDMQEREFQNIFTFAPGFEAATLKFPSGSNRGREPTAALLAELTQLAANQQAAQAAAAEHGEQVNTAPLEDALAALQMAGTASTSSSTTPSAAMSLTPSAPSGPILGGPPMPSVPTRRQTIGFARFKTRADALAAREHLQGRKIDTLTGASLKAEMAKKNLHTKRTTSGEELVGMLLRSGRLNGLLNVGQQMQQQQQQAVAQLHAMNAGTPGGMLPPHAGQQPSFPSAKEAWDSWPNQIPQSAGASAAQGADRERQLSGEDLHSKPLPPAGYNGYYPPGSSLSFPPPSNPSASASASAPQLPASHLPASSHSNASGSPPLSIKSPNQRPTDSKALLALAEEADELEGWSVGMGFGSGLDGYLRGGPRDRSHLNNTSSGPAGQQQPSQGGPNSMHSAIGAGPQLGLGGLYGIRGDPAYGTSPPGGSDHLSETGRSLGLSSGVNPGDQNPPINTLYVGNLPAISPPTHPPNFLEESLRGLFQRCAGFKRMSFRQKINGPMCFVEFEDVPYAAQAIKELYGHTLGGLVKGGIRLSYSKNSLGQRGNSHPSGINTSMFGGIAHTVALAGMTSDLSSAGGATTSTNPLSPSTYGLGLSQGPQPMQVPSSAPVAADRRSSDATTLSPTAQPFNASLPLAASPRSRYFGGKEPPSANPSSFGGFTPSNATSGTVPSTAGPTTGGFSPMSSPIRTPASFSWVSSGNGYGGISSMGMNGGMGSSIGLGGMGGGFDPFPGGVGSLNGAASAWGQSQGTGGH